ncbi:MAG: hypothetical protein H7Z10_07850, partial [Gemmatimonadaceae bacterium]|nr:hypothetical protein [Acetobacteraceae bacterium]
KRRMERANRVDATTAVIIGAAEVAAGTVQIKHMATGEQQEVRASMAADTIKGLRFPVTNPMRGEVDDP